MPTFRPARRPRSTAVEPLESRIAPATFIVNLSTDDPDANPGDGLADSDLGTAGLQTSLRAAIMEANAHTNTGSPDVISFSGIPASGAFVITLMTALPAITESVIIDGYTAPGASPNTLSIGTNAVLRVELDGSMLSAGSGLVLGDLGGDPDLSGGSTVRGLAIGNFSFGVNDSGSAIVVHSNDNHIEGNFLGTDVTGLVAHANGSSGVLLGSAGFYDGNVIGGTALAAHNLISGNTLGVWIQPGAPHTTVQGNLIGTDATGLTALPNDVAGIRISSSQITIGGTAAGAGNVISGNNGRGLEIGASSDITILGNLVGVAADLSDVVPNAGAGIRIDNATVLVQIGNGTLAGANVLAGNGQAGLQLGSRVGDGPGDVVTVQGNYIGTDPTGTMLFGNGGAGIEVHGSMGTVIGGGGPGAGNLIAFNKGAGVFVANDAGTSHVTISANRFVDNGGLSIDLYGGHENFFGVTANDPSDVDGGPNGLTNFPVLTTATNSGSTQAIAGSLDARPSSTYFVEFYAVPASQVAFSGHGDGSQFLGRQSVTTDATGHATISYSGNLSLPTNTYFVATATDTTTGDTSEFSLAAGPAPQSYNWTGTASTDWYNPLNWAPNGVPGPLDSATLSGGQHALVLTGPVSVASFTQGGNTLDSTVSANGPDGILIVSQSFSWTGGTHVNGEIIVTDSAAATFNGAASLVWANGALDVFGTLIVAGGGVDFNSGQLTVESAGIVSLNAGIKDAGGSGPTSTFQNFGHVNKLGTGSFGLDLNTVTNFGTINATLGTLVLEGFAQSSGTLSLGGGSIATASGLSLLDGLLVGAGTITGNVLNNGGYIDPAGPGSVGKITINGNYVQTGAGTLDVDLGGTNPGVSYDQLAVTGTLTLSGPLFVSFLPGFTPGVTNVFSVITSMERTGVFQSVTGEGALTVSNTTTDARLIRNGSLYTWDGGGGDTNWFNALNWSSDTVPGASDVAMLNTAATISVDTNATVGDFIQSAGTLTGTKTLTIIASFQWSGGTESGVGKTFPSGESNTFITGAAAKSLDTRTLEILGQAVDSGTGAIVLGNGATLRVSSTFEFQNTLPFDTTTGGGTLDVIGEAIVRKTGSGNATLPAGLNYTNGGSLEVKGGTVTIAASGTSDSGIFSAAPGTQIFFNSSTGYHLTNTVSFEGGGQITLSGGTLTGGGLQLTVQPGTTLNLNSGSIVGGTGDTITVNGQFAWTGSAFSGTPGLVKINAAASISGSAALMDTGWLLKFGPGSVTDLSATGSLALRQGGQIQFEGIVNAHSTFSIFDGDGNAGPVALLPGGQLLLTGANQLTFGAVLNNQGSILLQNGATLNLTAGFAQAGGSLGLDTSSTVSSVMPLGLNGGTLFGTGTVAADLDNFGGLVAPGPFGGGPGKLTITGAYTQSSTGELKIVAQSATPISGYSQLQVNGNANLAGKLTFLTINGFAPQQGVDYTVLSAPSVGGTFDTYNLPPNQAANTLASSVVVRGPVPPPDPLVVTTTADTVDANDGVTSLREAILYANGHAGTDTVTFNLSGGGTAYIISLSTALPDITAPIIINGYSQPGASANTLALGSNAVLKVVLSSSNGNGDGLTLSGGASTVTGLVINGFSNAILLESDGNTIQGNYLGTTVNGDSANGNTTAGVYIHGGNNTVGGTTPGSRNLLSGNQYGVVIDGNLAASNSIVGNYIGTDASGSQALGNTSHGVYLINGAADNVIGSTVPGSGNVISGNGGSGIRINGSFDTTIQGNRIGTDVIGTGDLGNSSAGVFVEAGSTGTILGGTALGAGNVISGNGYGIMLDGAGVSGTQIFGNLIGLAADGLTARQNDHDGIALSNGAHDNFIGSTLPGGANVISGNHDHGISLSDAGTTNNVIQGNLIGANALGTAVVGNGRDGINLGNGASGNQIGGTGTTAGNIIVGNAGFGIAIVGDGSAGSGNNVIQGNYIGTNPAGAAGFGNTAAGISLLSASGVQIGGTAPLAGNVIAFNNGGIKITIEGGVARGNLILGNRIFSNTGFGIDLDFDGPTANDAAPDADTGSNDLLNFPVFTTTYLTNNSATVAGSIDSVPNTALRIEFFSGAAGTAATGAQAAQYLDFVDVTTDASGHATFSKNVSGYAAGAFLTATATDANMAGAGTSEFAAAVAAPQATPVVVTPKDPFTFTDASGDIVKVKLTGPGSLEVVLIGGVSDGANIDTITLKNTTLGSKLEVTVSGGDVDTTVNLITTTGANQPMGSIKLGPNVFLGDGNRDLLPDLRVTGKLLSLDLALLSSGCYIKLGEGLPYNVTTDTTTPDTYNNHPNLTVGTVAGGGILIEVTGDGTPGGVGGGGLGAVVFGNWDTVGTIRTTQSIGSFLVKNGDFQGVLEVDKYHLGAATTANVGSMTVANGAWGSSGTEVEGNIGSFSATEFLAGASIQAASIGSAKTTQGDLAGTFVLTDPDAPSTPTYTVNSDFSGHIISAQSIKKLVVKGDFKGSLEAPSIGGITAYSFIGGVGAEIKTTLGALGLITSSIGNIHDYTITSKTAFSGIKVKLGKLTSDVVGIDNVHITALSIGNLSVDLAADAKSTGVDLTGIRNSSFTTTGTGTTKGTIGNIGTLTVKLKGAAGGNGLAIDHSTFDARVVASEFGANPASSVNTLGNGTLTVAGFGGASTGISHSTFEADTMGFLRSTVTKGKDVAATAVGLDTASFTATKSTGYFRFEGDVTGPQITALQVWAGNKIGPVSAKSKTATFGSLVDSSILAGQLLQLTGGATDKDLKAALGNATLGLVTLSGSLTNTKLVAGANIGAVSVGGSATSSLILAGARLGGDAIVGNGNDSFQRVAAIASLTVKGAFTGTSVVAGIASTNATFGDADDTVAAAVGTLTTKSTIGAVILGAGTGSAVAGAALADHNYAIQAQALKSLKTEADAALKDFATAIYYLNPAAAGEDNTDVVARLL